MTNKIIIFDGKDFVEINEYSDSSISVSLKRDGEYSSDLYPKKRFIKLMEKLLNGEFK